MKDRAYAKINLALDVFNVREDGYHDIESIMVPIDFYDELEIKISDENKYKTNKKYIVLNESNSIIKMINAIKEKYNINDCYEINLRKCVPMQAGLGGGTSDAASTLRIFKKLYNLNLTLEEESELCLKVGADVLFNYYNKPAIVKGIGDIIEPLNIKDTYYVLLVKPYGGVSTKKAYEALDMNVCDHPNINKLKDVLLNGEEIDGLLGNSLEQPALLLNKDIYKIKELLKENGASNILMSGSGSCVFALSKNEEELKEIYEKIREFSPYYVRLTKTLNN